MFKSFFFNKKWMLWSWGGGLLLIFSLLIQVSITVQINEWYKGFYDLLQNATKSNISEFWNKIYVFCYLAFANASSPSLGLKFYASNLIIFTTPGGDTVKIGTGYFFHI